MRGERGRGCACECALTRSVSCLRPGGGVFLFSVICNLIGRLEGTQSFSYDKKRKMREGEKQFS